MDDIDLTDVREQQMLDFAIREASREIPPGVAGDCDLCGEYSGRLIEGACAPCRERYKLP